MNEKHILINSITLLYRASQLGTVSSDYNGLVREIVTNIKLPEFSIGNNGDAKVVKSLQETVMTMCNDVLPQKYELSELLQRVKIDTGSEVDLYEAVATGISNNLDDTETKKICVNISTALRNHLNDQKVEEILNTASYKIKFKRNEIPNLRRFVTEVYNSLEPFQGGNDDISDPAIISSVRLSDKEQIKNVYKDVKDRNLEDGILRLGWQGINRMLRGGFRRGEEVVIGALQHNYKTGFSLSLFKQIAIYNTPFLINKTKKPLLIRISFEDDLTLNMEFLYRSLKENETGEEVDTSLVSVEEMADYVYSQLNATGYEIDMLRVDPTQWTYRDVINYCLKKESEGYEIHVLMLDYLKMLPTTGCVGNATGQDVRDMFRRVRNFCSPYSRAVD